MNASKEIAIVYRARNGRRYLTKIGALRASAKWLIKKKCYCERPTFFDDGVVCIYHDPESGIIDRLIRHLAYNDSRSTGLI